MRWRRILIPSIIIFVMALLFAPYSMSAPANKLMVAIPQEPNSVDPSLAYQGGDYTITENYAEYLISKAPDGNLVPGLATSWKVSPDGKEMEFTLRKGVKFHSGDSFTVKDAEFSFSRGRAKNSTVRTRLKSVERFEIIDDYRFKIHFKEPDVTFIPNRGPVVMVSKSYYDRVGEDKFSRQPVGTGPYKFVSYLPGEYLDIERFEDYWGKKPAVKEARFFFVPEDTTRVAKLKAGEVDIIIGCPYPSVKDVESSPNLKTAKLATDHPTTSVAFSTANPKMPWHDRRVRLAMAYAIDCDSIIKNVLSGIPNHYAFFAPYEVGYDPELKPYPYDPKKARQLLAEAGYPKGFEFKLYWISGRFPMLRETTEAVASYLEAVGIRAKLVGEEYAAGFARRNASKGAEAEYVACLGHGRSGMPDPTYALDLFYTAAGALGVYSHPEVEKILVEARATVDDSKRAGLIKKAARIIHEDVASIPIYNSVGVYAMKKNIDFTPTRKHYFDLVLVKDVNMR